MHWFVNLQTITYTNTIAVITYRSFTYTYLQETHILQSRCIVTHTYHYRDALEYIYVCRCIHIDLTFFFLLKLNIICRHTYSLCSNFVLIAMHFETYLCVIVYYTCLFNLFKCKSWNWTRFAVIRVPYIIIFRLTFVLWCTLTDILSRVFLWIYFHRDTLFM